MTEPEPKPTLSLLPHPSTNPDDYIHIVSNLLTPTECTSIIDKYQDLKPSNVTTGTVRTRQVFEDAELAEVVWGRLRGFYAHGKKEEETSDKERGRGRGTVVDEDGELWIAEGLNEVWRLCCYEEGSFVTTSLSPQKVFLQKSKSFHLTCIHT